MLSRLTASCLVVLALLPFTAPFRTCELSAFLGARGRQVPISRTATLDGDIAIANIPTISRIGRLRLIGPAHEVTAAKQSFRTPTTFTTTAPGSPPARARFVRSTIIRV
jgi:hypothetical protein